MIHCVVYCFAETEGEILIGASMVCMTMWSFPVVSSIKSNNANESEQGVIQGAVYSAKSLAAAIGPFAFTSVYNGTKDTAYPGGFWLVGAGLFGISLILMVFMPEHCYKHMDMKKKLERVDAEQEQDAARPSSVIV